MGKRVTDSKKPSLFKHVIVPNAIIAAVFRLVHFGVSPLLGLETTTTYFIVWFALLITVLVTFDYFVYLRPYQNWKSTEATHNT